MDEKVKRVKKAVKGDRIFISLLVSFLVGLAISQMYDIIQISKKSADVFEVKMVEESNNNGYYSLFVDGEQYGQINYNDYMTSVDENGNTNFRIVVIIEKVGKIIGNLLMALIFYFAYLILDNIFQPFSQRNIRRLRVIAILTMLLPLLPVAVITIMRFIYFSYVNVPLSQINIFVFLAGILFGILSEIFKYGFELQDEIDQIC